MKKKLIILLFMLVVIAINTGCKNVNTTSYREEEHGRENIDSKELEILLNEIEELKYLDYYGKSFKVSELTNQEILQVLNSTYDSLDGVSFLQLEENALNKFEYYINPEDILCDTHFILYSSSSYIYNYNSSDNKYYKNYNHQNHVLVGIRVNVVNSYKESYKENGYYYVVVYKVFSELLDSINTNSDNYYKTYKMAKNKEDLLFNASYDIESKMEEYKNDLVSYTYKFTKKNDNYVLKEYIINEG